MFFFMFFFSFPPLLLSFLLFYLFEIGNFFRASLLLSCCFFSSFLFLIFVTFPPFFHFSPLFFTFTFTLGLSQCRAMSDQQPVKTLFSVTVFFILRFHNFFNISPFSQLFLLFLGCPGSSNVWHSHHWWSAASKNRIKTATRNFLHSNKKTFILAS